MKKILSIGLIIIISLSFVSFGHAQDETVNKIIINKITCEHEFGNVIRLWVGNIPNERLYIKKAENWETNWLEDPVTINNNGSMTGISVKFSGPLVRKAKNYNLEPGINNLTLAVKYLDQYSYIYVSLNFIPSTPSPTENITPTPTEIITQSPNPTENVITPTIESSKMPSVEPSKIPIETASPVIEPTSTENKILLSNNSLPKTGEGPNKFTFIIGSIILFLGSMFLVSKIKPSKNN